MIDEEALEGARDVTAVLDRPDPLRTEFASPSQQLLESRLGAGAVGSPAS